MVTGVGGPLSDRNPFRGRGEVGCRRPRWITAPPATRASASVARVPSGADSGSAEPFFLGTVALLLFATTLLPLVVPVAGSLAADPEAAGALVGRSSPLASPRTWALLARSLALAAAVTTLALVHGTGLGLLLGTWDVVGRRAALLLHAFPIFLPPFLLALGWFHLFGRQGFVGNAATSDLLFGPAGVVGVLALAFSPVVTLLVVLGLRGIDPSLEEAARSVASPTRVALRILLPLVRPAVALAALVVFALSLSELGVPMFLRVDVYPAAVFARLGGVAYAPGEAFALVVPLLLVAILLVATERRWIGRRSFAALGLRTREGTLLPLGRRRALTSALSWAVVVLPLLPIVALAFRAGPSGFAEVPAWIGPGLQNSLLVGVASATAILLLGVILGHAVARRRTGAGLLDGLTVLGFLTPASVFGVGLIAAWNRPATQAVYGSLAVVILALVGRYAVVGSRAVAVAVAQSPPHLEEAARAFGARFTRRVLRIVLPMHARGIVVAGLLTLLFCLRDLETAVMVYPPGGETLPVRIFTLEANGPEGVVAALAVVHVVLTAAVLGVGALLLPRTRRS